MKLRKPILIGGITIIAVAILLTAILILVNTKKDIKDIVGKQLSLSDGLNYCDGLADKKLDDDISKAFLSATIFKVVSVDEENATVMIEISAPPIKEILNNCLPKEDATDFDNAFEEYMENVNKSISSTKQENLITTTVNCSIIDANGQKAAVNSDFTSAVYPNIEEMLNELVLNSLNEMEN
ncbi:MAG: hypothetical protein E7549_05375 [Ruminococcaceae bacterium]|nr:hypothetical protein [Oscillospiraceae bacterium]